ncbi:malate dehydrogenase (quinone) [Ferrigenium sp. UT4]
MSNKKVDVLLVGAGVMSATLGRLLALLDPSRSIMLVEQLSKTAQESSHPLHNAGTGHAGYCELNYTPQKKNGEIEIARALKINADFEQSLQFWAHLVERGDIADPARFINRVAHQSFVAGADDVDFLRRRHAALAAHPLFAEMEYSTRHARLSDWMPLVMAQRGSHEKLAATYVAHGADVDFGALTRKLIHATAKSDAFELHLSHAVTGIKRHADGWHVRIEDAHTGARRTVVARFVFIGAGGAALPLLQKAGVEEARGYGGFPVSGHWLVSRAPHLVQRHASKVYGKAPVGAPPMSVPHLDLRVIGGDKVLLYGPFAGITTKFLKQGSRFDLVASLRGGNLAPMLAVARDNLDLMRYLAAQAMQGFDDRVDALRGFMRDADGKDWQLAPAGKRVQIIKSCAERGGRLEFGTEIVATRDGSLATLLGASPGASTAVSAMLEVLRHAFPQEMKSAAWQRVLHEMIPALGVKLDTHPRELDAVRRHTRRVLRLEPDGSPH